MNNDNNNIIIVKILVLNKGQNEVKMAVLQFI